MSWEIRCGDVLDKLAKMPDGSVLGDPPVEAAAIIPEALTPPDVLIGVREVRHHTPGAVFVGEVPISGDLGSVLHGPTLKASERQHLSGVRPLD